MVRARGTVLALLGWSSLAFVAAPALSAQEGGESPPAGQEEGKDEAKEGEGQSDDEKDAKYFAIVGGDVHTGTGGFLRGATVLARNGKISEIGYDLFLPEGTERLDAHGLRVYPGLIALGATGRLSAGLTAAEGADAGGGDESELEPENEILWDGLLPQPIREQLRASAAGEPPDDFQAEGEEEQQKSEIEDTFDPFNSFLVLALATGITTAQQSTAAVKLKRYEIDGVLLSERHLATISWDLGNPTGIQGTRTKFSKAAAYLRELRAWKERAKKDEKEPSRKGIDTTALRVLSGEAMASFRASNREELLGIARFAQEHGFRPVIEGCEEGWAVAEELGRAGAYAVLTPRRRLAKDERLLRAGGASIENAAILHKSGVQVAVRPDSTSIDFVGTAGRDLLALPIEAGFAVRGGLSDEAALQAMTLVPARVLGVDHRVGSLEVGKDCDAIVTDGDVLHYQTFVQYTVVDGKLVYDKEKELYFAHIRPRPKPPEAPAATPETKDDKAEKAEEPPKEEKADEKKDEESEEKKEDEKKSDESDEKGGGRSRTR